MADRPWSLETTRTADKELAELSRNPKVSEQIEATIQRLLETMSAGHRPQDMRQLRGFAGEFRIDSGEYRILFSVDQQERRITVWRVQHRREVYRRL